MDVVVVGGGIAGLTCTAELAKRGVPVLLLEKDDIGFEQSGRSAAAITLPGESNGSASGINLLALAAQEWDTFEERWECEVELNREGWISVAVDEDDVAWWHHDRATWQVTAGDTSSTELTAIDARKRYPSLAGPFVALDIRRGGHVNRTLVLRGLQRAALHSGAQIRRGTMVTGFETSGSQITAVRTDQGRILCGAVVIAAGVWSARLCDQLGLHIPLQRIRVSTGETCPVSEKVIPGFLRAGTFGARQNFDGTISVSGGYRTGSRVHDLSFDDFRDLKLWVPAFLKRNDVTLGLDWGVLRHDIMRLLCRIARRDAHFVPLRYEPRVSKRAQLQKLHRLIQLVPALKGVRIRSWFAGVIDLTPDLEPVLGLIPGTANVYVLTGFSGHGFILGPASGRVIASVVTEGNATGIELTPYRPERFIEGRVRMREQLF